MRSFSRTIFAGILCAIMVMAVSPVDIPAQGTNPFVGDWLGAYQCGDPPGGIDKINFLIWGEGDKILWTDWSVTSIHPGKLSEEGSRFKLVCVGEYPPDTYTYTWYINKSEKRIMYGEGRGLTGRYPNCRKWIYAGMTHWLECGHRVAGPKPGPKVIADGSPLPPDGLLDAKFLAGKWLMVQDSVLDGKMNPEYPPDPLDISHTGANRFSAKYSSGQNGIYSGELRKEGGRVIAHISYSDPVHGYSATGEGAALDNNTIQGRFTDSRKKTWEFRWTRK